MCQTSFLTISSYSSKVITCPLNSSSNNFVLPADIFLTISTETFLSYFSIKIFDINGAVIFLLSYVILSSYNWPTVRL